MIVFGVVLVWSGVAVAVLSALAAIALRPVLPRLPTLRPVTVLAGPLVGLGLAVRSGWTLTNSGSVQCVLTDAGLTGVAGP